MDNKKLEEKISGMDLNSIYNTSPKALKELTNDFCEKLVRLLMMKAKSINDQKGLLKYIKNAYGLWQKKTRIMWSEHPMMGGYPEYFDTMEANIDSDRYITTSGSVPVGSTEYYQFMSQQEVSKSSDTYSKEMVDAAIAAVKAQIPHFEYDQQNEKLSIVYGENKGKVNLDEVIEKKTKDVVNKQLEEIASTDADIDEMFVDIYGKDLVDQVNKEMKEEEKIDDYEDTAEFPPQTSQMPQAPKSSGQDEIEEEEWDDTFDNIFNKKVRPQEIKKTIEKVKSEKIKDRRFYYVAYRILKFIKWIPVEIAESDYLRWINCHFERGWENNKSQKKAFLFNLEGTVKRLNDLHPSEWKDDSLYGNLGKHYRLLAISFKNAFTYTMIDKKPVGDSESYEHLKDRVEFLSGAREYHGTLWAPDEAYINDGK